VTAPDWATLETELATLLSSLLEIPCQWRTQPTKLHQGAHAFVDALAPTALGADDVRWADVGGTPETPDFVQATVVGQRELTLQVSVWSPSQSLSSSARMYLERLRTRLRWPSTLEALRGLGLALVTTENVVDVDPVQDGRVRSQSTLDVRIAYGALEADAQIPWIEDARVTGTFTDAAGDPSPYSFDLNPTDPTP